jgi:DNA-binding transcriptional LysR family regulator
MNSELNHLRHFFEVARQGSFTRAAQVLRTQQPGMSRSVRLLEETIGVTLIERRGRRFRLTAAGERVRAACARIFSEVEEIARIAEEERGELRGPVRVASSGALASRLLPDALPRLLSQHPHLWPMIFSAPAQMGMARVTSGEVELGLFFYVPTIPTALTCVALAQVEFRLVVRADHAEDPDVLRSFIGSREVEDPKVTNFPTLERLRRVHPKAQIRISTNDADAHLRMVEAGLGVSILPCFLVEDGLRRRRLADVFAGERFEFPILLVTRNGHALSRGAQALLDEVVARVS